MARRRIAVILLLWVYYLSLILFFGAGWIRASIRMRGERVSLKTTAVNVQVMIVEQVEGDSLKVS